MDRRHLSSSVRPRIGNENFRPAIPARSNHELDDPSIRLSPIMELTIVGGLGVFIMIAPNVATFISQKASQIKTRVILWKERMGHVKIAKKLEMLNRRRKYGSLVRVIGAILPNFVFNPTPRICIYIPNMTQLGSNQWGFLPPQTSLPIFEASKKSDLPSENDVGDGLIEAFEIASEVTSNISDEEEELDEEDASSNPEGWTQAHEQRKFAANFNPTVMDITDTSFARCSTPKADIESLHFNASQIVSQQGSRICVDQTDITELKEMVAGLVLQINCLKSQIGAQQQVPMSTTPQPINSAIIPLPASTAAVPPAGPPPPPPPPPPMPPMPTIEKRPLIITKKGNQDKILEKKPQVSLSDVLKELPNAKLRRIERSPGGTPLKPQLKLVNEKVPLDIGNQLAFALRKRYECMHSPACDTDDTDKENMNGSGDSFEDSPVSAKRILFPVARSPLRKSSTNQQNENHSPFGQHLLKKRNNFQTNENSSPSQSAVFALREQN